MFFENVNLSDAMKYHEVILKKITKMINAKSEMIKQ